MADKELIIKAKNGDTDAFCLLYGEYKDRLFRYAYYKLGNYEDAEDAVSSCVLSAFEQIKTLKRPEAFNAWIFRILFCACSSQIKEQIERRSRSEAAENLLPDTESGERHIERSELKFALEKLTEEERDIVLLSVLGGLKSREIAKISSLTSGSVRSKLRRSLAKMREYLE